MRRSNEVSVSAQPGRGIAGAGELLVQDQAGNLLLVTVRNLIDEAARFYVVRETAPIHIGSRDIDYCLTESANDGASALLAWIGIEADFPVEGVDQISMPYSDPIDALGTTVAITSPSGPIFGTVSRVNHFISIKGDLQEKKVCGGLIFVEPLEASGPLGYPGISGKLITDENDTAVGIVVGYQSGGLVCAPLRPFLEKTGFYCADEAAIDAHNEECYSRAEDRKKLTAAATLDPICEAFGEAANLEQAVDAWFAKSIDQIVSGRREEAFLPFQHHFKRWEGFFDIPTFAECVEHFILEINGRNDTHVSDTVRRASMKFLPDYALLRLDEPSALRLDHVGHPQHLHSPPRSSLEKVIGTAQVGI